MPYEERIEISEATLAVLIRAAVGRYLPLAFGGNRVWLIDEPGGEWATAAVRKAREPALIETR